MDNEVSMTLFLSNLHIKPARTLFWHDIWIGNSALKTIFPSLYEVEAQKRCLISDRVYIQNNNLNFSWDWYVDISASSAALDIHLCKLFVSAHMFSEDHDVWEWSLEKSKANMASQDGPLIFQSNWVPKKMKIFLRGVLENQALCLNTKTLVY
ncbi:hypothetical protein R6Q59_020263 [Mikania micrantha]